MSLDSLFSFAGPYLIWVWTAVIVVLGVVVYLVVGLLIRRIKEPKTRVTLSRLTGAVVVFFVLVAILALWVNNATVFVLIAGLVGAGIAFSLQAPLTSLVAWLVLLALKPFEIGDRVQSGDVAGDVVAYNLFFFSVLEIGGWTAGDLYTGRLVEVPNSKIITQPLVNYSRNFGFLWDSVVIGVYYDADWARAREILLEIAGRISAKAAAAAGRDLDRFRERHFMPRGRLEPQVFLSLASTTINLSVWYVTDIWNRPWTRSTVTEQVLREFRSAGIDIAYPSLVLRPTDPAPPASPGRPQPSEPRPGPDSGNPAA